MDSAAHAITMRPEVVAILAEVRGVQGARASTLKRELVADELERYERALDAACRVIDEKAEQVAKLRGTVMSQSETIRRLNYELMST